VKPGDIVRAKGHHEFRRIIEIRQVALTEMCIPGGYAADPYHWEFDVADLTNAQGDWDTEEARARFAAEAHKPPSAHETP
jgi:hypothetical protein